MLRRGKELDGMGVALGGVPRRWEGLAERGVASLDLSTRWEELAEGGRGFLGASPPEGRSLVLWACPRTWEELAEGRGFVGVSRRWEEFVRRAWLLGACPRGGRSSSEGVASRGMSIGGKGLGGVGVASRGRVHGDGRSLLRFVSMRGACGRGFARGVVSEGSVLGSAQFIAPAPALAPAAPAAAAGTAAATAAAAAS